MACSLLCPSWKPNDVESKELMGWEPGAHDCPGASWPDLYHLASLSLTLGGNLWALQALTRPQDHSLAAVSKMTSEREELSVLQRSRY